MRDKVTRQCPQTTTSEEKGEPKRIRTEVRPLTSLTPYRQAKPAHRSLSIRLDSLYVSAGCPLSNRLRKAPGVFSVSLIDHVNDGSKYVGYTFVTREPRTAGGRRRLGVPGVEGWGGVGGLRCGGVHGATVAPSVCRMCARPGGSD